MGKKFIKERRSTTVVFFPHKGDRGIRGRSWVLKHKAGDFCRKEEGEGKRGYVGGRD